MAAAWAFGNGLIARRSWCQRDRLENNLQPILSFTQHYHNVQPITLTILVRLIIIVYHPLIAPLKMVKLIILNNAVML